MLNKHEGKDRERERNNSLYQTQYNHRVHALVQTTRNLRIKFYSLRIIAILLTSTNIESAIYPYYQIAVTIILFFITKVPNCNIIEYSL